MCRHLYIHVVVFDHLLQKCATDSPAELCFVIVYFLDEQIGTFEIEYECVHTCIHVHVCVLA